MIHFYCNFILFLQFFFCFDSLLTKHFSKLRFCCDGLPSQRFTESHSFERSLLKSNVLVSLYCGHLSCDLHSTKSYDWNATTRWWAMQQIEMCEKQANSSKWWKKRFVFLNFQLIIANDKESNSPARYSFGVCVCVSHFHSVLNSFLCTLTIHMNRKNAFFVTRCNHFARCLL